VSSGFLLEREMIFFVEIKGLAYENAQRCYHPAVPVTARQFCDPEMRERLRTSNNKEVLRFWSELHRETDSQGVESALEEFFPKLDYQIDIGASSVPCAIAASPPTTGNGTPESFSARTMAS
jgi:hypothetical protein